MVLCPSCRRDFSDIDCCACGHSDEVITIVNAFSINMLSERKSARITFVPMDVETVREKVRRADAVNCAIGHADTACIVSQMLGVKLSANRVQVKLEEVYRLIIAQYIGPRLPEGATELPEGARIEFWGASCR